MTNEQKTYCVPFHLMGHVDRVRKANHELRAELDKIEQETQLRCEAAIASWNQIEAAIASRNQIVGEAMTEMALGLEINPNGDWVLDTEFLDDHNLAFIKPAPEPVNPLDEMFDQEGADDSQDRIIN